MGGAVIMGGPCMQEGRGSLCACWSIWLGAYKQSEDSNLLKARGPSSVRPMACRDPAARSHHSEAMDGNRLHHLLLSSRSLFISVLGVTLCPLISLHLTPVPPTV